jgi:Na+/proline symporter
MINSLIGFGMLGAYLGSIFALCRIFRAGSTTKAGFLVADRTISEWLAAFSIASSWIWAPSLFVSAQKAYLEGIVGLFWFTVPNILTLVLFAHFSEAVRSKIPKGYTLTAHIKELYGKRTHGLYMVQNFVLLIGCLAVQMLGGGKILAAISGLSYPIITLLLAVMAISYTMLYGLKASIITDWFKMGLLLLLLAIIVPWAVTAAGGLHIVAAGLGGKSGAFTSLFSDKGISVFWNFGLATTIGLLSGTFSDQAFYQRTFAVTEGRVKGAYYKGAFLFALVPLSMSLLGFIMAGSGAAVSDPSMVNLAAIKAFLPAWAVLFFVFLLVSALLSAMDSHLTAASSIVGHDLTTHRTTGDPDKTSREEDFYALNRGRLGMIAITIVAIGIANIPGMQILWLFLFNGVFKSSTMLPTILTVLSRRRWSESGVFYGILTSLLIGMPIFVYGSLNKNTPFIVAGALIAVLASGIVTVLTTLARDFRNKKSA